MAEVITFYFPVHTEYAVRVEVDDPADYDQIEQARDKAWNILPSGICAQCSGWGQKWSLDLSSMDIEPTYAEDESGNVVWGEDPYRKSWPNHSESSPI